MKTRIYLFVAFFVFFLTIPTVSQEDFFSKRKNPFHFDHFFISHLPGGSFYTFFIENYAPDTTYLIEENNGFSLIDNPRVYFEGDPFVNFNWYLNGFNLNSILDPGAPAVRLPFSSITGFRLQGESPILNGNGLNVVTEFQDKGFSRATVSSVFTDLGGYSPWAASLIPGHASERDDKLYTERRKIVSNYFVDYMLNKKFKHSSLLFSLNYFDIRRQFNDFNQYNRTFEEHGKLFSLHSRYRRDMQRGFFEFFGVLNILERSHLNAELGRYPLETLDKGKFSFITGLTLKVKKMNMRFSFILETEDLNPQETSFSKDLMDNDGEGFLPENRFGEFVGRAFNFNINIPLETVLFNNKINIKPFVDFKFSDVEGMEEIYDFSAISFDQNPYLVTKWNRGGDYKNSNMSFTGGVNLSVDISDSVCLFGKLLYKIGFLNFNDSESDLRSGSPGIDLGVWLFKGKNLEILLSYGILPYEIRENINFFLEKDRPSGTIYRWNDTNSDRIYQNGEQGRVFGYTGNQYHFIDENISVPVKKRLLIGLSTRISKRFVLNIKGIYKKIKNSFWVKYNQEYGFYEMHNGHNVFFYNRPFRDYYLSNADMDKDPFYAQLLLNIEGGEANRWFYSFSFMAHMGMGYTSFGNGPGASDIGIVDESQANPNSLINGYGRLDGDRGFTGKMFFGFHLSRNFFMGVSLKYRDGTPFAFFNTLYEYNQWITYYKTIKAEDKSGIKGGPREDFISDVSVRLNYNFRLFNKEAVLSLSVFNIFDFGNELSEYVFSGGTRDAMELQIPRSVRLTLSWQF